MRLFFLPEQNPAWHLIYYILANEQITSLGIFMCGRFKRKFTSNGGENSSALSSRKKRRMEEGQKSHMVQKNSLRNTESIGGLLDGSENERWTRPVHRLTLDHRFKPVLTSATFHHLHTISSPSPAFLNLCPSIRVTNQLCGLDRVSCYSIWAQDRNASMCRGRFYPHSPLPIPAALRHF